MQKSNLIKNIILYSIPGILIGIFLTFILIHSSVNEVQLILSPDNGMEILSFIQSAEESIYIEVYILSYDEIVEELIKKHNSGIEVKVILEKRMGGNNQEIYKELFENGVNVKWASYDYKLTHTKIIIIDKEKVLVGSHNLSYSALNENREVSVILYGPIVNEFLNFFLKDWLMATY